MPKVGRQDKETLHSDRKGKGKQMALGERPFICTSTS